MCPTQIGGCESYLIADIHTLHLFIYVKKNSLTFDDDGSVSVDGWFKCKRRVRVRRFEKLSVTSAIKDAVDQYMSTDSLLLTRAAGCRFSATDE